MEAMTAEHRNRRRSFGIGGAGNIRSHAEATIAETEFDGQQRRRSSVWSTSSSASSTSRRAKLFGSVKNLFSRSPPTTEDKEEDM